MYMWTDLGRVLQPNVIFTTNLPKYIHTYLRIISSSSFIDLNQEGN